MAAGNLAEGEGFEPPKACTLVVFKPHHPPLNTKTGQKAISSVGKNPLGLRHLPSGPKAAWFFSRAGQHEG